MYPTSMSYRMRSFFTAFVLIFATLVAVGTVIADDVAYARHDDSNPGNSEGPQHNHDSGNHHDTDNDDHDDNGHGNDGDDGDDRSDPGDPGDSDDSDDDDDDDDDDSDDDNNTPRRWPNTGL